MAKKQEENIGMWKARRRFAKLPKKRKEKDRMHTSKHTTKKATKAWMKDPSIGDVQGIDTMSKKYRKLKQKKQKD